MKQELTFNPKASTILHIDLNSCFATIEQQANPLLRGKPVAVAAYTTASGCILAPSIEAKKYGVKTGMRVKEGKVLCPSLIVLPPDPAKYRNVHLALRRLLSNYTDKLSPKSIDEFVLDLQGYPCLAAGSIREVAAEIKKRIKKEIGEWLTVSIGIAPNRFLAKAASSLHKPDGLDEINKNNFFEIYESLKLTELPYIKIRNAARLNSMGIYTILDFYNAPLWKLQNPNLKYQRDPLHSRLVLDAWCLKFPVRSTGGTALHSRKDLAVSSPKLPLELTLDCSRVASPFELNRLCSHLYPCGRRALPATLSR